ncbi:aldo/keto reductase [Alloscardovia theropitheci]|uniref:Aldo/keto reductase n=1 Tax=Alloscardovia theropitheci TaxID=2496842 RepID=A0A4V6N6W6_9BIFI|nr:aldo/keto reductase [Alloscardovia theropitheci]TCD54359.1 aldo/keto reductase [Alloscardovia theropitheci]
MAAHHTITLHNGLVIPSLGFGTFQPSASAGEGVADTTAEQAVFEALRAGYRLIDTAAFYQTEGAVGRAIRRAEDELGIPRSEIFVTSKLWVTNTTYDGALRGYDRSLEKSGLDYFDLYLIHNPMNDIFGAWRALSELYLSGKIRSIGVSNFSRARMEDFISFTDIVPHVNQIEVNVFHQQNDDITYMNDHNIVVEAWAPFARGRHDLFNNTILRDIAHKYDVTVSQIIERWLIQRGIIPLPKSVNKDRIQTNYDVWNFELTDTDMARIKSLDEGKSQFFDWQDPAVYRRFAQLPYAD